MIAMKLKIFTIVFSFLISVPNFAQDSISNYFSIALKNNLRKFIKDSRVAYSKKQYEEGERLFREFTDTKLVGTTFDNFLIKAYDGEKVNLSCIKQPLFIVTYASWLVLQEAQIDELNELSNLYPTIKFIVLFWDKRHSIRKLSKRFDRKIKVCYANESYMNDERTVSTLKHTLGFPTYFFIDGKKKVVKIDHYSINPEKNYNLKDEFSSLLQSASESNLYHGFDFYTKKVELATN
jgi:hypothetical protein